MKQSRARASAGALPRARSGASAASDGLRCAGAPSRRQRPAFLQRPCPTWVLALLPRMPRRSCIRARRAPVWGSARQELCTASAAFGSRSVSPPHSELHRALDTAHCTPLAQDRSRTAAAPSPSAPRFVSDDACCGDSDLPPCR